MESKTRYAEPLQIQLSYNQFVVQKNADSLSQEESLSSPPQGGNCVNWVIGHVNHARGTLAAVLGLRAFDPDKYKRYERGSAPLADPSEALPLDEMLADFQSVQEGIVNAIGSLDDGALDAKAPFSPVGNENETVGSLIAGLVFHESYHLGQTGVLRRLAGKDGAIA